MSDVIERAERLISGMTKADADLVTTDTGEPKEWRAVDARGKMWDRYPHRSFVTCIPANHDCWNEQTLSTYSGLGVWDQNGLTTRPYAEAIAHLRNAAPEVVHVLRQLVRDLRSQQQTIAAQAALLDMGDYEEVGAVVDAAEKLAARGDPPSSPAMADLYDAVDVLGAKRGQR